MGRSRFPHLLLPKAHFFLLIAGLPKTRSDSRQAVVMPQLSIIYLLLRSRNYIFGGSVMNSTLPADLLELKARFET
jgi:hypothetical protein